MEISKMQLNDYGYPTLKLSIPWYITEILTEENIDLIMFCHMGAINGDS